MAILNDQSGFYSLRKHLSPNSKEIRELEDVEGRMFQAKGTARAKIGAHLTREQERR